MNLILFSIGAAIGAPIRYWLDSQLRSKYKFPVGIFLANIVGSFAIGIFAKGTLNINGYLLVGFCGALTTWSTFIVDLYQGIERKEYKTTALNLIISLLVGVFAFKFGKSI